MFLRHWICSWFYLGSKYHVCWSDGYPGFTACFYCSNMLPPLLEFFAPAVANRQVDDTICCAILFDRAVFVRRATDCIIIYLIKFFFDRQGLLTTGMLILPQRDVGVVGYGVLSRLVAFDCGRCQVLGGDTKLARESRSIWDVVLDLGFSWRDCNDVEHTKYDPRKAFNRSSVWLRRRMQQSAHFFLAYVPFELQKDSTLSPDHAPSFPLPLQGSWRIRAQINMGNRFKTEIKWR